MYHKRIALFVLLLPVVSQASLRERVENMERDIFQKLDNVGSDIQGVKKVTQELAAEFKQNAQAMEEMLVPLIHDHVKKLKEALDVKKTRERYLDEVNTDIANINKFLEGVKDKVKELYPDGQ